ncbi:MAG TPA: hypothetical protein VFL30_09160, partial [Rhodanobacteraceae bacterium]|nr:hypothetical protein [Rhodanobacteraceae bacterium]
AAADRDEQIVAARERNRLTYVVVAETPCDESRVLVVHAVPDLARGIVLRVAGQENGARQAFAELPDGGSLELDLGAVERYRSDAGFCLGSLGRLSVTTRKSGADTERHCRTAK